MKQKMVKFLVQSTYSREASSVRPGWLRFASIQDRILSASFPLAVLIHYRWSQKKKKKSTEPRLLRRFLQTPLLSNEKRERERKRNKKQNASQMAIDLTTNYS